MATKQIPNENVKKISSSNSNSTTRGILFAPHYIAPKISRKTILVWIPTKSGAQTQYFSVEALFQKQSMIILNKTVIHAMNREEIPAENGGLEKTSHSPFSK